MSEIKGQLFGILLVVAVFGVVGGTLVNAFKEAAGAVETKITEEPDLGGEKTSAYEHNSAIESNDLLKF